MPPGYDSPAKVQVEGRGVKSTVLNKAKILIAFSAVLLFIEKKCRSMLCCMRLTHWIYKENRPLGGLLYVMENGKKKNGGKCITKIKQLECQLCAAYNDNRTTHSTYTWCKIGDRNNAGEIQTARRGNLRPTGTAPWRYELARPGLLRLYPPLKYSALAIVKLRQILWPEVADQQWTIVCLTTNWRQRKSSIHLAHIVPYRPLFH